jgi:hypothetical protein
MGKLKSQFISQEEIDQEIKGDNRYHEQEKQVTRAVSKSVESMATAAGYRRVNWLMLTKVLIYLQLTLSFAVTYTKADFVTLTSCSLAMYAVNNTENLKRKFFRVIVGLVFLSLVYDLVYTALVDLQSGAEMDGGQNDGVKRFAEMIGYVSFMFRVSSKTVTLILFRLCYCWCCGRIRLIFQKR